MSSEEQAEPYPPPCPPKLEQPVNNGNHMFMSPRNQAERDAWAAARWSIDGWLYRDIAKAMDITTPRAWEGVQRGMRASREITQATAEQARAMHRARLEAANEVVMEVMARDHVHVAHGKVVVDEDGNPVLDDAPKLAAAGKVKELSESLRKLDGLDQPAKVEMSGGVKYEVVGIAPEDLV